MWEMFPDVPVGDDALMQEIVWGLYCFARDVDVLFLDEQNKWNISRDDENDRGEVAVIEQQAVSCETVGVVQGLRMRGWLFPKLPSNTIMKGSRSVPVFFFVWRLSVLTNENENAPCPQLVALTTETMTVSQQQMRINVVDPYFLLLYMQKACGCHQHQRVRLAYVDVNQLSGKASELDVSDI